MNKIGRIQKRNLTANNIKCITSYIFKPVPFFIFITFLISCEKKHDANLKITKYDNNKINKKGAIIDNKKVGYWVSFYSNGNIKDEVIYVDGKLTGEFIYYYESGNICYKGFMRNNNPIGEWIYFYENGNIKMKGNKNGDPIGVWEYYTDDKKLDKKVLYGKGKPETLMDNHFLPPVYVDPR